MITNDAKLDLYNLMAGKGSNGRAGSYRLPAPSFDATTTITFVNDIQTKLSITGFTIIDILGYKDYKIVYGNANNKGVIGVFDLNNNLIETINKVDDYSGATTGTIDLDQFKKLEIDRNGFIYGLATHTSKTYFIRFSDILEQIGVLAFADVDVFYSARVDMSTEVPKDPAKPTENIMGSTLFNDYEKIAMSNDFKDSSTYSFALWSSSDTKIHITKVVIPNGAMTKDDVSWDINEKIIVGAGNVETPFTDISGLGIGTGNYITSSETILGSVIVETTKTSTTETWTTGSHDIPVHDTTHHKGQFRTTYGGRDIDGSGSVTLDFSAEVGRMVDFQNAQTLRNVNTTIEIAIDSYERNTVGLNITLDNAQTTDILANRNLVAEITFEWKRNTFTNAYMLSERLVLKTGTTTLVSRGVNFLQTQYRSGDAFVFWDVVRNIVIKSDYEFKTTSSARATTQLLGIVDGKDNGADKYVVKQIIANIYKGSKPVFLNEIRAYAPLLSRDDGQFNVYEFTPLSSTTNKIEKAYLEHTPSSQADNSPFDIPIADIASGGITEIVSVVVDSVPIYTPAYERVGDSVRIKSISKDKTILITYNSNVPSPKKLLLSTSTNGDDIFITGVNNQNELNTTSDDLSIVGVGDDGANDFGFTLYSNNSNTELNTIAEDSQAQGIGLKHIVATRQNDVLFIYGYNQDFTKEMKWISIYPQSLHPYTFLPYDDVKSEFHLERLNGADTDNIKDTLFDRTFDNISSTSGSIIANSNAKSTDFNYNGQATLTTYGKTNKPLFVETIDYTKTRQEEKSIYVNLNVDVVDKTNADIDRPEATNTISDIFSNKNEGHEELAYATKLKLIYTDGTSKDFNIPTSHFSIVNGKLKLSTIIRRDDHKLTSKIQWLNLKGDLLGETTPCDYKYMQIGWEIEIQSSSNGDGGSPGGGGTNPTGSTWNNAEWGGAEWH